MKLTKEQIEKAVNWWAEVIKNPKMDAGADSIQAEMAEMMAMKLVEPVTEAKAYCFERSLSGTLEKEEDPYLSVDYHPSKILSESLTDAGIPLTNAPWKTNMTFRDGGVQVYYGYRAEQVEL